MRGRGQGYRVKALKKLPTNVMYRLEQTENWQFIKQSEKFRDNFNIAYYEIKFVGFRCALFFFFF